MLIGGHPFYGSRAAYAGAGSPGVIPNTLNPAAKSTPLVLSGGNLTASGVSGGTTHLVALSIPHKTTGKFHVEASVTVGVNVGIGFASGSFALNGGFYLGQFADSIGWFNDAYVGDGGLGAPSGSYTGFSSTNVLSGDLDAGLKKCWFSVNGTSISGDPVAGTGGFDLSAWASDIFFAVDLKADTDSITINFGATSFAHPTTGFSGW